jgi:hypothetical protein
MVPGRLPPDDPREWLNRARSSLTKARQGAAFPEIYLEDLCFDAQQADFIYLLPPESREHEVWARTG